MNHDSPADLSSDGATSQDASLDRVSLSAGPALSSSPRPPGLRKQDKRKTLFEDLIRSLDILVYIELSAIYYMESVCFYLIPYGPSLSSQADHCFVNQLLVLSSIHSCAPAIPLP